MPLGFCTFSSQFKSKRIEVARGSACLLGDIRRSIFRRGIDVSFRFRIFLNNQLIRKVASVETSTIVLSFCFYHDFVFFVVHDDYFCFDLSSLFSSSIPFQLGFLFGIFFPPKKSLRRRRLRERERETRERERERERDTNTNTNNNNSGRRRCLLLCPQTTTTILRSLKEKKIYTLPSV